MSNDPTAVTLIGKLRQLDLDEGEAALLTEVFRLAASAGGPEVEGFASLPEVEPDPFTKGFVFPSRNRQFKGSDEELQAIVDWLGSLELKD